MSKSTRVRCRSVNYRQGYVEIGNVREGRVNIETWEVAVTTDIAEVDWVSDEEISDDDVLANTELELSPSEARTLANALLAAAKVAETSG